MFALFYSVLFGDLTDFFGKRESVPFSSEQIDLGREELYIGIIF